MKSKIDRTCNSPKAKPRVLMAMSGGIDSTVAAMLLLDQGYELVGVTYRVYDQISQACMEKEKGCCSVNAIFEAKHMAQQMGFEHHILDIRKDVIILPRDTTPASVNKTDVISCVKEWTRPKTRLISSGR